MLSWHDPHIGDNVWEHWSYYVSGYGDYGVIGDIEALARGLQSTNHVNPEVNRFWTFVLMALSMILGLVTLALVISNGGDICMSLGRFGRGAATRKRLRA